MIRVLALLFFLLAAPAAHAVVARDKVPADRMILDIGPASARALAELLAQCNTVVWNGPLGAF